MVAAGRRAKVAGRSSRLGRSSQLVGPPCRGGHRDEVANMGVPFTTTLRFDLVGLPCLVGPPCRGGHRDEVATMDVPFTTSRRYLGPSRTDVPPKHNAASESALSTNLSAAFGPNPLSTASEGHRTKLHSTQSSRNEKEPTTPGRLFLRQTATIHELRPRCTAELRLDVSTRLVAAELGLLVAHVWSTEVGHAAHLHAAIGGG